MTRQVSMTVGGESPSREAINLTTGRKTRYNPSDVCAMSITKSKLRIGNWNVQGLNSPGKIDVLANECDICNLDIVASP